MAGLAIQALTLGGFAAALAAFVVTAAVLVGLLFAAALVIATAQQQTVERLRAGTPTVKRWGGWVLIVVGGWFVILGVWAGQFARLFPV
jgi:hypothetical protein